jgi:hypothetical protein
MQLTPTNIAKAVGFLRINKEDRLRLQVKEEETNNQKQLEKLASEIGRFNQRRRSND